MSNNNKGLDFSIADCQQMEEEFTKKAATLTNFFTNRAMKAEAVKQVIARADDCNKIKVLYDEGKREPDKKPGKIRRAVITAITAATLMGAAYFGALTYFGKQEYDAKVQGLTAENGLVLLRKQKAEQNTLLEQERANRLQKNYAQSLETISQEQQKTEQAKEQNNVLQGNYAKLLSEKDLLENNYAGLQTELETKNKEKSELETTVSELQQCSLALNGRIIELDQEGKAKDSAFLRLIEEQVVQRTKAHGEYKCKGPFNNFVSNYAEFFFGRTPTEQEKTTLNSILRAYIRTDGKSIDETIHGWNCNTIILRYNNKPEIIDP